MDKEQRKTLERSLCDGRSLSWAARQMGVSVSSAQREILRNRSFESASNARGADRTDCAHYKGCKKTGICGGGVCFGRLCKRCPSLICEYKCNDYERRVCDTVTRAPFVCNACDWFPKCTLGRYRYSADAAQALADSRARESRQGIDMTREEIDALTAIMREKLKMGQSVHHIFQSNEMQCSERSFYRYVENQAVPIKSIDLAKKVKYKKRKKAKAKSRETGFFAGHEYEDSQALPDEYRATGTMVDTVLGKRGESKCILSLHRADLHFQIYMLLLERTEQCVVEALDRLEEWCEGRFREFFGLMLLDRGSEFEDIKGIETSVDGGMRCAAYFCDPQRSDQKAHCEKNHVELRKIIPKGTSLQKMDVDTLAQICSHVNSSLRKGCGDASPMRLAMLCFPDALLKKLGLQLIPPRDVIGVPNKLYKP
jgi:IS30 family transposase